MKKITLVIFVSLMSLNCGRTDDSSSSSSSSSSTTTQTTKTSVKLNVINSQNIAQKDIVVMMFKTKVTSATNLPNIEKQVTSDVNGLADFDLTSYITSETTQKYYFEAFKKNGNSLVWVSIIHPEIDIKKNTQITTSIIVN